MNEYLYHQTYERNIHRRERRKRWKFRRKMLWILGDLAGVAVMVGVVIWAIFK